ncbi:MAG: 6-phosphogluconolactonase [Anaerolineales bacterium]|nr:6-phosphogluconolactonase [Anaerolineales bacterium]MCX7609716.1 6-phosphogluconolactonase [Anaerolineales bacterium]MDW8226746.1 6-phosphogluconolactonase [Anaerolineales bacterium]
MISSQTFQLDEKGQHRLVLVPSPEALAAWGAREIVRLAQEAIAQRGLFHWVLSGGNTPQALYQRLAELPNESIPWSQVHVWWGDERNVPLTDEQSNYRMAWQVLLGRIPLPQANIHRIRTELGAKEAASEYAAELQATVPAWASTLPRLDLILLGMGEDGHTASLFPYTSGLTERQQLVIANPVPQLQTTRITMTLPLINAAAHVMFLVSGASKAETLWKVLFGPRMPLELPAQEVQPVSGTLTWLVDAPAATAILSELSKRFGTTL